MGFDRCSHNDCIKQASGAMRFGSGWPSHTVSRLTTRQMPAFNVQALRRAGALGPGVVSEWRWRDSDPLATTRGTSSTLFVSVAGGPEKAVQVDYVPGSLGGSFPLFVCPECSVRRWSLYLADDQIACRQCLGLAYQSRHTTRPAMLRAAQLRKRLLSPVVGKRRHRMIELLEAAEARASADLTITLAAAKRRSRSIR